MGVKVTIRDNHIETTKRATEEAIKVALDAAGLQASTLAKRELQKSPSRIDTGLLRNSITHAVAEKSAAISSYSADKPSKYTGKTPESGSYSGTAPSDADKQYSVYIGTNVEYAQYVHEGTDRMPPNRFLKNALEQNKAELNQIIAKVLRDQLS